MNRFTRFLILLFTFAAMQSCVDSDYHWDNINTEGVLNIPPIPLGSYEDIIIKKLDYSIEQGGSIELPTFVFQFEDTIRDIFGTSAVKDFFHKDMTRDLSIEGDLDMNIMQESNMQIDLHFNVLDINDNIIDEVEIQGTDKLQSGKQNLSIVFPKEDGEYMENAEHLLLKIRVHTPNELFIPKENDKIKLSNLVIKTGGYHVEL